jgi:hypothetical protein
LKITKPQKKELNSLIHQILELRDKKCLKCNSTINLQASHIYSVGSYKKLQFDIENIIFLCLRHHLFWWHKEPLEAWTWIQTALPKERLDRLKLRTQQTGKGMHEYKLLKIYLMKELQQYDKS